MAGYHMEYEARLQRLHDEVRRAALQSMSFDRQQSAVLQDNYPMLSRGGNPAALHGGRAANPFVGQSGPMPRVQLGRRQRRDAPSPLGVRHPTADDRHGACGAGSSSWDSQYAMGAIMPDAAPEPRLQSQPMMRPVQSMRPTQQQVPQQMPQQMQQQMQQQQMMMTQQLQQQSKLRVSLPMDDMPAVHPTPSTAETVNPKSNLSNDEAASLLLALSPRAMSPSKQTLPGVSLSRNVSGLDLPPAVPLDASSRFPSLVDSLDAPQPPVHSSYLNVAIPAPLPNGLPSLEGLPLSPSVSGLDPLPLSRNVSGISMSRCLSMLGDGDPNLPGLASASLSPAAPSPAAASERPYTNLSDGAGLSSFAPNLRGGALPGVPMSRDVSGISVNGLYSLLGD